MRQKRKVILGILAAILAIVLFGVGIHFIDNMTNKSEKSGEYDYEQDCVYLGDGIYELNNNLENYLIIGTDDSGNEAAVGTKDYRGSMADFLLLLVINKTDQTYGFLQIDRNTITDVPGIDTEGNGDEFFEEQICCAHWYGGNPEQGCENTVYTVSELLGGVPIYGYFSMNMGDIGILNHAVGGVEVTLDEDFSDKDPAMTKGKTIKLNDEQAEIYARGRLNIGDESNAARMERQIAFMQAFKAKATKQAKDNPDFTEDLFNELKASTAVTDIPRSELSVILNQIYKGEDLGILRLEGERTEGMTLGDGKLHEEFYPTEESIAEVVKTLCGITETDRIE